MPGPTAACEPEPRRRARVPRGRDLSPGRRDADGRLPSPQACPAAPATGVGAAQEDGAAAAAARARGTETDCAAAPEPVRASDGPMGVWSRQSRGGAGAVPPGSTRARGAAGWARRVLRGGVGDEQRRGGEGGTCAAAPAAEGGAILVGEEGSELSEESCRALGIPGGSRWAAARRPAAAAGDAEGLAAGGAAGFDVDDDDEALLRHAFASAGADADERLSRAELEAALHSSWGSEGRGRMGAMGGEGAAGMGFEAFKERAGQVRRWIVSCETARAESMMGECR